MKYSSDLPLEERQRLDQMWANIAGGPNRNIYANENRGLNSMFRPRDIGQPITQPATAGLAVMGYHRRPKAGGGYEYHTTGSSADPLPSGGGWESSGQEWPGMIPPELRYDPGYSRYPDLERFPTPPHKPIDPGFETFPMVPKPIDSPRPHKGPFGGGQGKTFLNRFERLLDGLEGLVGKLGGTPESPFSSGEGGGLAEVIKTPFTPTQDY